MTKQTILGRVTRLAGADLHALLDPAEDPGKALAALVAECAGTVLEAEQAVAAARTELRFLGEDHAEDQRAAAAWAAQARAASGRADALRGAGRTEEADRLDGLARAALVRQVRAERAADGMAAVIAAQTAVADRLGDALDSLKIRLTDLQSHRDRWVAHARDSVAPEPGAGGTGDEVARFAEAVRRADGPEGPALLAEFELGERLGDAAEVAARLAALKATT
ncbi:PspA/IM30 family protein [Streptomyces sp. G45]|uniref:PspA/IM30 family protein n=1 Tax=Streptomyces sp. G45 TaxID=3406627 RepID=UPI003C29E5FF